MPTKKIKQISINKEAFELLCMAQCTETEICNSLNVSIPTLISWCKDTYKNELADIPENEITFLKVKEVYSLKGKAKQKMQFIKRTQTSDNLLKLWLTNYCGVKDKVEAEVTHETIKIVNNIEDD